MDPLKILVIDDHVLFAEALSTVLERLSARVTVVRVGTLAAGLARIAQDSGFDLALVDLALPDAEGLDAVHRLRAADSTLALVVVSATPDAEIGRAAIDAGCAGFIPKDTPSAVFLSALELVLNGGIYLPHGASRVSAPPSGDLEGLTTRRREVLRLLAQGLSNKRIALELNLAEGTVKLHVSAILRALGARNRTEAALKARARGLAA